MNASSARVVVPIAPPRRTGLIAAALAAGSALLAHVRETLTGVNQTHEVAAMDDRMLRDIGVEAAWRPTLHRDLEYRRL